ncbi:hypothetical protein SETIT_8G118000v2 [Setaria italica]|uniref:BTB domain-containing protein n=1 Tax=Setaria italica TaxID=4555 RepID=K3ZMX9_SETIT|nr:hypothetical protein SETIT_8G118000v2 [Setaria italica]
MSTATRRPRRYPTGNGCGIKSPRIDAGGLSWRIVFYPNGMRPGTTESISLYLQLDTAADDGGDDDDVEVLYQFMLPGPDQGLRFMSGKVMATFNRLQQNAHGFKRCISNDYFKIRCDVTVLATTRRRTPPSVQEPSLAKAQPSKPRRPTPSSEPALMATLPSRQLQVPSVTAVPSASGLQGSSDLGRLLATKEGADVDFEVGGMVFAAHRCVLAARSPVSKADLFGPTMEENTSYIRINDMNAETFQALLHYIYTDSLPDMNDQEVGAMAHHLLSAADRFDLQGLKSIMENRLCQRTSYIGNSCFRFIACPENDRAVMATDDVEHLTKSCPSIVRELVTKIFDSRELNSGKEME